MIRFASHAYNTGRQTAQRETNTNILEKFGEFEIVDPDAVIESVYPSEVKSASDLQLEGVSTDYDAPPAWLGQRQKVATMEKIASGDALLADEPKPEPYAPDPRVKMAKVHSQYVSLQKEAEEARYQASVARDRVTNAIGQFSDYFKKHARDRHAFATVEHAVQTYYPKSAQVLMDYAYDRNKMKEARAKDTKLSKVAIDHSAEPFTLIKECVDLGEKVNRLRGHHKEATDAATRFKEGELAPFVSTSLTKVEPKTASSKYLIEEVDAPAEKEAAGFLSSVAGSSVADTTKNILDRALSDAPVKEDRQKTLDELDDPTHNSQLRQIRAQALLSEMMDDDVISGYQPQQVMQAYNEISQLSPRAAMQPLIARSLLRRHLQGNMEPFEAKEITDIEKGVGDTEGTRLIGANQLDNALI